MCLASKTLTNEIKNAAAPSGVVARKRLKYTIETRTAKAGAAIAWTLSAISKPKTLQPRVTVRPQTNQMRKQEARAEPWSSHFFERSSQICHPTPRLSGRKSSAFLC